MIYVVLMAAVYAKVCGINLSRFVQKTVLVCVYGGVKGRCESRYIDRSTFVLWYQLIEKTD